jgi:uncharacterized protein YbcV (DUF1398 family)
MGANKITVYEGNTAVVTCAVVNSDGTDAVLTGYTATLTVKVNKADTASVFTSTGIIAGNDITFNITATNNTQDKGVYYYEVTITDLTSYYTLVQDRYVIKESIVYIS